jgi:phosphatidylglycerophosphate synthase
LEDIEEHTRVHDMILGPLERPALRWLCERMPGWVVPDTLTTFGVVGSLMIFFGYWLTQVNSVYLWLASFGFLVNWFGDSLDGNLARFRKIERPKYGFFIDHTVDSFSMAVIFIGLGLSAYVRLDVAAIACVGYLLMSIHAYVRAFVSGQFKISYARVGPTELRVIAFLVNTLIFFFGNPTIDFGFVNTSVFNAVVAMIATVLILAFIITTLTELRHWAKIDPPKKPEVRP